MDYFLLDAKTGELHTARPLDREALPDATGIIILTIRVCILIFVKFWAVFSFRSNNLIMFLGT